MVSMPAASIWVPGVVSKFKVKFGIDEGVPLAVYRCSPGQCTMKVALSRSFFTAEIWQITKTAMTIA
jgi:hypothetical protein